MRRFRLLQPYFGHLSCTPFICMICKVQGVLICNLNPSVVEKLPSFVKLVSPFRSSISGKVCHPFDVIHLEIEFLGCMVAVEMPGM